MAVTIHDIARELNLSAMTVSRVLNSPERSSVAAHTRERVLKAAADMGYRPNRYAKALVTRRPATIAIWIDHLHSSIYSQIAHTCREEIQKSGLQADIYEMDWFFPKPGMKRRLEWMVDGIIAVDPPPAEDLDALFEGAPINNIPRVNLGSSVSVAWDRDYVRVDLQRGAQAAVEHLISVGCKRIAYCVPAGIDRPGLGNFDAYTNTVLSAKLEPEYIRPTDWELPGVRKTVREHIERHGKPDGIFCQYDELAIAAYRAIRDLKLNIPDDVMLIGCEGNEFMEYFDPPLSTIAMPVKELCHRAWEMLNQRLSMHDAPYEHVVLPHRFFARESSDRPPS
jgi:LacI family transcriptional regulator